MEKQRIEEIAANRLQLISPLLDPSLDRDKKQMLKEQICIQSSLSERTIRRYLERYQSQGFEGLKPQNSGRSGNSVIPPEVLKEAIALRREVPKRSINEIIRILEWEGKVKPGTKQADAYLRIFSHISPSFSETLAELFVAVRH